MIRDKLCDFDTEFGRIERLLRLKAWLLAIARLC